MKLKTFFATYILFLSVLFLCFGIVSVFMTDSQMNMYMERSAAEYRRISSSLARDMAVLHGISHNLADDLNALLISYILHYAQNNVFLELTTASVDAGESGGEIVTSFMQNDGRQFINVVGYLPEPFGVFRLDYMFDVTASMAELARIQRILLFVCVGFAVLTAGVLFTILSRVFKPLAFVSQASRKIAEGNYSDRVAVHGKNELADMAQDFNAMAEQIENQMQVLIDDAEGKQQFIDNIGHELRTPLTSIFGYAEYMQKIALDNEEMIDSMQYIMDEAMYMQNMSESLLTLATLRGYKAERNEISIPQLFDDIRQSLQRLPDFQTVQFTCNAEADTLHGQEDLIKSLLLNLCTNALKANAQVITLTAKSAVLTVTDNGQGIPKESLAKITEPFYRVDKARSREAGGAGLGLALCKRIAEAHGAELTVESTLDVGTKVEIIFEAT